MPIIRIIRKNEFVNRGRKIKILIDNQEVNTILNGETKELEFVAGTSTIQAKIDIGVLARLFYFQFKKMKLKPYN